MPESIAQDDCWEPDLSAADQILKARCLDLLTTFGNMIWILYSPVQARCRGTTLSPYVLFFVLYKQMEELGVPHKLATHQGVYHLPRQSRLFALADLSTEDFEALWKNLRHHQMRHSNGSEDPAEGWHMYLFHKIALRSYGLPSEL